MRDGGESGEESGRRGIGEKKRHSGLPALLQGPGAHKQGILDAGFLEAVGPEHAGMALAAGRKAVTVLGGKIISSEKYLLPDGSGRSLIVIEKTAPTPAKYPRGQNNPRLSPIG